MMIEIEDGRYEIRLLQEFGRISSYLTPEKIQELWLEYSKHDTLFSDYTQGKVEPFLDVLLSRNSIIFEIFSLDEDLPVGLGMLTRVIPNFDAMGHFTLWDSRARGREPIFLRLMRSCMERFNLRRISAEVPGHQSGVIRMIKRLGFQHEGTKRDGNLHKGSWVDLEMFGITRPELEEKLNG